MIGETLSHYRILKRCFSVMELLEGESLERAIAGRPLEPDRVLELGTEIADALEAAHGRGIVHRDVKPGNTFLTRRGHAKLLDQGRSAADRDRGRSALPGAAGEAGTARVTKGDERWPRRRRGRR